MKKIATLAGSALLFAVTLVPALAAGNNCTNSTTGPLSTNYCTINNTSNVTVNNVNDAQIVNNVTAVSNTGNNSASGNTLGGSITTGNATLNTTIANVANVNTTNITGGPAASGNTGLNEITGPSSDNQVNIYNTRRMQVENSNTASVENNVNATSDAGSNRTDWNTGPASIRTGNSGLNVGVGTHVNDNLTTIAAGAGGTGGNSGTNSTTGPWSTDYVTINNTSDARVNNVNDLIVGNFVNALANTGRNSASNNTLGGDIQTGNVTGNVQLNTEGNFNTTSLALAMGGFANDGATSVSGPGSDNQVYLTNNQTVDVENWNNKCKSHNADRLHDLRDYEWDADAEHRKCDVRDLGVWNYNDDLANAGYNDADYNTAGGVVTAGWTSLYKSVLTHLNDTLTSILQ